MPAHSSHLLQPLDISCFSVLKRFYGKEVEQLMRNGVNHIDKPDFLTAYLAARANSITPEIARSGFMATGLIPYNPEQVLSKLNTQLRTPTPPPEQTQRQWIPETPYNPIDLELQAKVIKEYIRRRTTSPPSPTDIALQ